MSEQGLSNVKDKIQILLNEYNSLRTEVIHRTNNLYQMIAVGAVLFSLALARPYMDVRFWFAISIGVGVLAVFGFLIHNDLEKAARRLRELESDINHRAGETLLIWETVWGGVKSSATLKPRKS
jgi:hypothetical protein